MNSFYGRIMRGLRTSAVIAAATVLAACAESPQIQLTSAVMANDVARVERLLDDPSVDINWRGPKMGDSALASAAANNRVEIVQLLLRRGADANIATDEKSTPLQAAAYNGHAEVVKLLIEAGVDVNVAETRYGFTALMRAARNGHLDVMKMLLDAGADPAARLKDGRSAMDLAEHYGHSDAAQLLMLSQQNLATRSR